MITHVLKQPTRWQREQRPIYLRNLLPKKKHQPIWSCCRWRLPRFTVTKYARLCGPIPRLIPCGFQRTAVSRHLALCSPDFPPSLQRDRKGLPQFIMAINCQIKCDGDCLASFIRILTRGLAHLVN